MSVHKCGGDNLLKRMIRSKISEQRLRFKKSLHILLNFSSSLNPNFLIKRKYLAEFFQVNADRGLYYLLFGEALLNDGVTFVLFEGHLRHYQYDLITSSFISIKDQFSMTRIYFLSQKMLTFYSLPLVEGFKELALVPNNLDVPW